MKKLAFLGSAITSLLSPVLTFADENINIKAPAKGYKDLGDFIGNLVIIAFSLGILIALVMLIWGSFEWITSGGDKENVGKARNRIINALIGLAVLAVAFALAQLGAQILGFPDITKGLPIPAPKTQ